MKTFYYILMTFFLSLIAAEDIKATHLAGGEIFYRYIGDSTGIAHHYEITAIIYRDMDGSTTANPSIGDNIDICFSSSFYTDVTKTFSPVIPPAGERHPKSTFAYPVPSLDSCVSNLSSNFVDIGIFKWRGTVVLNGICSDWRLSFGYNARNSDIDNLATTGDMFIEAQLNNTFGPNSSPKFISPAATAFCIVQPNDPPFVWIQQITEADGDSVRITLDYPLDGTGCGPGVPYAYDLGRNPNYSPTNPITTHNNVFNIDEATGTFTFSPSTPEVAAINIVAKEYKFDTQLLQWVVVGTSSRDLQCIISANCKSNVISGPVVDLSSGTGISIEPIQTDSIYSKYDIPKVGNDSTLTSNGYSIDIPVIAYNCFDNSIDLSFDIGVNCSSISTSDFRVIGPDSVVRPIADAQFSCNTSNNTRKISLSLHQPLDVNGDFMLYVKTGHDGNTLTNQCGFELAEFYVMIIRVNDCPILDYEMKNVSVVDDKEIKIEWEADPSSFNPNLFQHWKILRAHNDDNFYPLTSISDVNQRSFTDRIDIDEFAVDQQVYQYAIQMYTNNSYRTPTSNIHSILLSVDEYKANEYLTTYWNKYDGFEEERYEVYLGDSDLNWEKIQGQDSSARSYQYDIPNPIVPGTYVLKVQAKDAANSANQYISESNWIYFDVLDNSVVIEEPEDPIIPNVMTPNGDFQNDRFYIATDDYSKISVAIHNRWGKLVFKDDNFQSRNSENNGWDATDMNNGEPLSDGVYYYTINLRDNLSGKSIDYQGSLTIMRGSN